jgi:hypothetical protein
MRASTGTGHVLRGPPATQSHGICEGRSPGCAPGAHLPLRGQHRTCTCFPILRGDIRQGTFSFSIIALIGVRTTGGPRVRLGLSG